MTPFIQFLPIYQERVWGGRMLESFLGRKLPGDAPIGESWELVDRTEAQSQVSTGQYAGMTLRQLMEGHAAEIMGPAWPKDRPFPILVKWLDCRDRLSVQVHPPASVAAALGGEPKTENWYMARTDAGAAVYAGLHQGVTRASFEQAIASGTVEQCLDRLLVREGDSLLIHSGTMHAIDAGNVILEIQQNSDTTYRVYDWGRRGLDGKPRTLHVEQSLAALDANTAGSPALVRGGEMLARCREFTIRRVELRSGMQLTLAGNQEARILSVIGGELQGGGATLRLGDNILLPYAGGVVFTVKNDATVLVTEGFSQV